MKLIDMPIVDNRVRYGSIMHMSHVYHEPGHERAREGEGEGDADLRKYGLCQGILVKRNKTDPKGTSSHHWWPRGPD